MPAEAEPTRYAGRLLTANFVAEKLDLNPATVRKWAKHGTFNFGQDVGAVYVGPPGKRQILRIKGEALDKLLGDLPGE